MSTFDELEVEFDVEAVDTETGHSASITVDLKGLESFKLLLLELTNLHSDMRVGASPFADRLEGALKRFGVEYEEEAE
jgi:hypothetical protein